MAEEKDRSLKEEEAASGEVTDETVEESPNNEEEGNEELREAYSRIEELEEQLATTKDSLLRKAAELENVRKRVQRERLQLFEEAKAGALEDFLPVAQRGLDDMLVELKGRVSSLENQHLRALLESFLEEAQGLLDADQSVIIVSNIDSGDANQWSVQLRTAR